MQLVINLQSSRVHQPLCNLGTRHTIAISKTPHPWNTLHWQGSSWSFCQMPVDDDIFIKSLLKAPLCTFPVGACQSFTIFDSSSNQHHGPFHMRSSYRWAICLYDPRLFSSSILWVSCISYESLDYGIHSKTIVSILFHPQLQKQNSVIRGIYSLKLVS